MFEELSDEQREVLYDALDRHADISFERDDQRDVYVCQELLQELERIGMNDDKTHASDCPNLTGSGSQVGTMPCPDCGENGYHPNTRCDSCDYALCWCVGDDESAES